MFHCETWIRYESANNNVPAVVGFFVVAKQAFCHRFEKKVPPSVCLAKHANKRRVFFDLFRKLDTLFCSPVVCHF